MSDTVDLSRSLVMKEDYAFVVMNTDGEVVSGAHGVYSHDTRFLREYRWDAGGAFQTLLRHSTCPDRYVFHYARISGPSQHVGVTRNVRLTRDGLLDELLIENTDLEPHAYSLSLRFVPDFTDLFETRGFPAIDHPPHQARALTDGREYVYDTGAVRFVLSLRVIEGEAAWSRPGVVRFQGDLPPRSSRRIRVRTELNSGLASSREQLSYDVWRSGFDPSLTDESRDWKRALVLRQAIDDLRSLLLFTESGPVPAAGIPWFVASFGRDALLTAYMMLPWQPDVCRSTIRHLALHQGTTVRVDQGEEPGKIAHEFRHGELARTGRVPHHPYYGTIDATPLFLVTIDRLLEVTGDVVFLRELRPAWEAALSWIVEYATPAGQPFLRYTGAEPGNGLVVQSWKDSDDSMSHRDGRLATGSLAPVEVQGYAFAAFEAAARFYDRLGDPSSAERWTRRAAQLREAFHTAFWCEALGTYAMALDHDDAKLEVLSSNAGHLLWSGIVPDEAAPRLVKTLFSEQLWSGWGIRTLGTGERRYNPVSYHNGSVWPHDTALIAAGLDRYGYQAHAARIRDALFDLAESQPDNRLPELIAGYPRGAAPPVPYPVACRPQAWDAASLLLLARL